MKIIKDLGLKAVKGSYTIEAVYIMGITFFALATVFGAAYRMQADTTRTMTLHMQIEQQRHQEDNTENPVRGKLSGDGQALEISVPVYNPEEWLRMISLME